MAKIEPDKQKHIAAGAAILVAVYFVGLQLGLGPQLALFYARVAVLAAGVGKEVYDAYTPGHTPDPMDAAATIAGGEVAALGIEAALLVGV